jgi:hypothetical protein
MMFRRKAGLWKPSFAGGFTPASLSPAWWGEVGRGGLFQSNAGTTAAVSNGDLVGYLPDQSGNGKTLTSAADDATRLTLGGVGTKPFVTCTAASSTILRNTTGLNSYNAGASSWFFALKSNSNAVNVMVAAEGLSGGGGNQNPIYSLAQSNTAAATTLSAQARNLAGTSLLAPTQALQTNAFNGSNHVIGMIDDGTQVTPYLDGVAGTPFTYTARTGTLTTDRFALGGLFRSAAGSFWNGDIYGGVIVNRVITTQEISDLNTYLTGLY